MVKVLSTSWILASLALLVVLTVSFGTIGVPHARAAVEAEPSRIYPLDFADTESFQAEVVYLGEKMGFSSDSIKFKVGTRRVEVRAPQEVLDRISEWLPGFDVPSGAVAVQILLIRAEKNEYGNLSESAGTEMLIDGSLREELRNIRQEVDPLLGFESYRVVGQSRHRLSEKSDSEKQMLITGDRNEKAPYRVSFRVDTVNSEQRTVRLSDFRLEKRLDDNGGEGRLGKILAATLNLKDREPARYVISRSENDPSSLILSVRAAIED